MTKSTNNAADSDLNLPFESDWLNSSGIENTISLQGGLSLEIYRTSEVSILFDSPGSSGYCDFSLPHIKTREQLLKLIGILKPDHPMGIK